MRLLTSLYTGREGLMTHGGALASVADNIANVNTVGFKGQRAEFSDLLAESVGSLYGSPLSAGNGSAIDTLNTILAQGGLEQTGRDLDVAIEGRGYFMTTDGTSTYYRRAGNFQVNTEGELVTPDGDIVMGFTEASPEDPVALNVRQVTSTVQATAAMTITGNLDASHIPSATAPDLTTPEGIAAATQFRSVVNVVDSVGAKQSFSLHFIHTGVGTWDVQAYANPVDVGGVLGDPPVSLGTAQLAFGPDGQQTGAGSITVNANWTDGAASAVTVDLAGMTQFGSPSAFASVIADGKAAGNFESVAFDKEGNILAVLDTGEEVPIGQLALAVFNNDAGLDRIGAQRFAESVSSGEAIVGVPKTAGRGSITPSSLENSNVDLASSFIDMIRFQRGYQANSQVIQNANQMLEQTIQIA